MGVPSSLDFLFVGRPSSTSISGGVVDNTGELDVRGNSGGAEDFLGLNGIGNGSRGRSSSPHKDSNDDGRDVSLGSVGGVDEGGYSRTGESVEPLNSFQYCRKPSSVSYSTENSDRESNGERTRESHDESQNITGSSLSPKEGVSVDYVVEPSVQGLLNMPLIYIHHINVGI